MVQSNIEKEPHIALCKLYQKYDTHIKNQSIKISHHQDQILEYKGIVLLHTYIKYLYSHILGIAQ